MAQVYELKFTLCLLVIGCSSLGAGVAKAQDPIHTDPEKYKVLLENERVRVLEFRNQPGEETEMHSHPPAVAYVLAPLEQTYTAPDGGSGTVEAEAGAVVFLEAQTHSLKNIGTTDSHILLVELKSVGLGASRPSRQESAEVRVLFLGNSAYVAYGGSLSTFEELCREVNTRCEALSNFDVLGADQAGRIDWAWQGLARDTRVFELLRREPFDYVVLWTRFGTLVDRSRRAAAFAGLREVLGQIAKSGATAVLVMPYTPVHALDQVEQTEQGFRRLLQEVERMRVDGGPPRVRYVPMGRFWRDGVEHFGSDVWYADPYHGSRLAQYATAHLWFAFLLQRDPRGLHFAQLPTYEGLDESKLDDEVTPEAREWIQRRVWELFSEWSGRNE